jgi:hypothetical protein
VVFGRFEYILEYDRDYDFYSSSNKGGAAVLDPGELAISIGRIKSQHPRAFVVVFPHWGENYQWRSEEQARMGRALIDAGADLILGHGAHMIQEIERRRDSWIVYSIGNFVFNSLGRYGKGKEVLPVSFIAKLSAVVAESEVRLRLRLYPIFSDNRKTGFQPRFLTAREFGQALRMLRTKSAIAEPLRTGHDTHSPYLEFDISRRLPCVD